MSAGEVETIDGVSVAHVRGDIDAGNAAAIQQRLSGALGPDSLNLVVDLSGTGYVDSAGFDMLLRLGERLRHRRAKLLLVIPAASQLQRLATMVGLTAAIAVHPSLAAALGDATSDSGAADS